MSTGSYVDFYGSGRGHSFAGAFGSASYDLMDTVYSPDGRTVVTTSSDGLARVWSVATIGDSSPMPLLVLAGHGGPVATAGYSPWGSLLTASADGTAKIWDTSPREQRESLLGPPDLYVTTAAFDPVDERILATAGTRGDGRHALITVWDRDRPNRPLASFTMRSGGGNAAAEFSSDGRYLAATGGAEVAFIYRASDILTSGDAARPVGAIDANGRDRRCSSANINGMFLPGFWSVEFNRGASEVVTADEDGSACIWSVAGLRPLLMIKEPPAGNGGVSDAGQGSAPMHWAAFSADGRRLLTSDSDGSARIWSVPGGTPLADLAEPSGEPVNDAFFDRTGTRVVTATDAGAAIWDASTDQESLALSMPSRATVSNAALSSNGHWALACGSGVGATIFDAHRGLPLTDFPYDGAVSDCEFSPDGRYVAIGGEGGETRIFSTELAGRLRRLEGVARTRVRSSSTR